MRQSRHYSTPDEYRQRPREFDPLVADLIIERVRDGEMVGDICHDRDMPTPGTFLLWVEQDPSLAERYEAARRIGTDVNLDEATSLAFQGDTQRAKIQSDALFRHVERSMPQKYGPRAVIQTATKDDAPAGIDYGMEVRRKLEAMAQRVVSEEKK